MFCPLWVLVLLHRLNVADRDIHHHGCQLVEGGKINRACRVIPYLHLGRTMNRMLFKSERHGIQEHRLFGRHLRWWRISKVGLRPASTRIIYQQETGPSPTTIYSGLEKYVTIIPMCERRKTSEHGGRLPKTVTLSHCSRAVQVIVGLQPHQFDLDFKKWQASFLHSRDIWKRFGWWLIVLFSRVLLCWSPLILLYSRHYQSGWSFWRSCI